MHFEELSVWFIIMTQLEWKAWTTVCGCTSIKNQLVEKSKLFSFANQRLPHLNKLNFLWEISLLILVLGGHNHTHTQRQTPSQGIFLKCHTKNISYWCSWRPVMIWGVCFTALLLICYRSKPQQMLSTQIFSVCVPCWPGLFTLSSQERSFPCPSNL